MEPAFQSAFNVVKGAAPARLDVADTAFDECGKKAIRDVAEAHTARGDEFREQVAAVLRRSPLPVSVSGYGSMMSLHALADAPTGIADVGRRDPVLQELLYFGLLQRGVYTAFRGMVNVGLAHSDA